MAVETWRVVCLFLAVLHLTVFNCSAKPMDQVAMLNLEEDDSLAIVAMTSTMDPHEGHTGHMEHTGDMDHTGHMEHTGHMDHSDHTDHMDHTGHMDHTDHDHPDDGHAMSHPMWFHATEHATIWFEGWHTMTWAEMLGSCIGIAVIAALYEGLKALRASMMRKAKGGSHQHHCHSTTPPEKASNSSSSMYILDSESSEPQMSFSDSLKSCSHIGQSLLHVVQVLISMLLMLVFMSYNVYLCLAVLVGAGCGYYLFAWHSYSYRNDCCN